MKRIKNHNNKKMKMKKIKIIFTAILILATVYFAFGSSNTFSPPHKNHSHPNKIVSNHKLKSALTYLESVCGNNGIQRMVILRQGKVVYKSEESDVVQNVWSCTKSFTSTVLGLLVAEGKCTLDDKVWTYLPELKENYPDVTFRHYTTMTSGYKARGDDEAGGHGQSTTPFQPSEEQLFDPGIEFRYWDSAMNIFALALTKAAGKSIKEYFKEKVADPIGMDPEKWDWRDFGEMNGLVINGGAGNKSRGIFISAEELARFGQLFLNRGSWNGKQIVPEEWVEQATSPQINKIIPTDDSPYGFNWWTSKIYPDAPEGTFAAKGFNNNKCIVIPEWNIVVARLGLDGNIGDQEWNHFLEMLGEAYKE